MFWLISTSSTDTFNSVTTSVERPGTATESKLNGGQADPRNRVLFAWLFGAAIVAHIAMLPALLFLLDPARLMPFGGESISPVPFVIGFAIANIIISAIAVIVGLRLEPKVHIGVPLIRSWVAAGATPSTSPACVFTRCSIFAFGLAVCVLACGVAFRAHLPDLPDNFVFPPVWQGILMMLGAAVREEIIFRFFALNLIVLLAMKILRKRQPTAAMFWIVNVLVALIFAWMHLIPAGQLLKMNAIATGAAIVTASVAGILFGWVYRQHGLPAAIFTHGIAGLLVYLGSRGLIAFTF